MAVAPVYQQDDGSLVVDPSQAVPSDGNGNPAVAPEEPEFEVDPVAAEAATQEAMQAETDEQAQADQSWASQESEAIEHGDETAEDKAWDTQAAQAAQSPTAPIQVPTPKPAQAQAQMRKQQQAGRPMNGVPGNPVQQAIDDTKASAQNMANQAKIDQANREQAKREEAAHQAQVQQAQAPQQRKPTAPVAPAGSPGAKQQAKIQPQKVSGHGGALAMIGLGFLGLGVGAIIFGGKK